MKHIKLHENFDFDFDDFDEEETDPNKSILTDKGFVQFLKDNDKYDDFIEGYKPFIHDAPPIGDYCEHIKIYNKRIDYIYYAFGNETFMKYWKELDKKWIKECNEKYNY